MFGRNKKTIKFKASDTSVRVHESGYIMRRGENLILAQESASPQGTGWLLVTNMELLWIHNEKGIYLHVGHDMINYLVEDKNRLVVSWTENHKIYKFQMRLREGFYTIHDVIKLLNIQFGYVGKEFKHIPISEDEIKHARDLAMDEFEYVLQGRLDRVKAVQAGTEEGNLDSCKFCVKQCMRDLECTKTRPFLRSDKIPDYIPLCDVWNDCYYDDTKDIYVTFRKFRNGLGPKTLAMQAKLDYDGDGVAFAGDEVCFRYGYPVIYGDTVPGGQYFGDENDTVRICSMLCTASENMITDDMFLDMFDLVRVTNQDGQICARNIDDVHNNQSMYEPLMDIDIAQTLYYETEAPRWIGGGFFKLTNAERRIGLKWLPWLTITNESSIAWTNPMKLCDV